MPRARLCISVCAGTVEGLTAAIRRAAATADLIEARFDRLGRDEIARFADRDHSPWSSILDAAGGVPIISTLRPEAEGGGSVLTVDERLAFHNDSIISEYCDVEADIIDRIRVTAERARICSRHETGDDGHEIGDIYGRLRSTGAEVIKIAVAAGDAVDALPVWRLLEQAENDGVGIIPIAMGDAGQWTRILGPAHGAFLTYASLDTGAETAEGQITAAEMRDVYRIGELTRDTRVYAVIGDPVSGSLSPYMHNAGFCEAGIDAVFIRMRVVDLDAFMRRMVAPATREAELNFGGFSVTMPHKLEIMRYLDDIDAIAGLAGAVNTVIIGDGGLTGSNTDVEGFIAPLRQRIGDIAGSRAAVFGAGGAARACVTALANAGAEVTVFARDPARAQAISDEFKLMAAQIPPASFDGYDIVVNATPIGMKGTYENDAILNARQLEGVKYVYDIVTRADDTPLLANAKAAGAVTIGGVEMLIAQGVRQFELWTGRKAPSDVMRETVLAKMNI